MSITFTTATLEAGGPEELNVHNGNAVELLQLLGLPVEPEGEAPAEDFLGRVLVAQALLGVATDDEHGRPSITEGRFSWGRRRPGALAEHLATLHQQALWASHHNAWVVWS